MNLTKIEQKEIMDEIVPVYTNETNNKVVNARDLHKALQVKRKFADWIKTNLKNYNGKDIANTALHLKENSEIDYVIINLPATKLKGKSTEYILTLDTAKELAMMSRCEKGKEIRRYFISIEKVYNQTMLTLKDNNLTDTEKITKAIDLSDTLIADMKKELDKANKNKSYNKAINVKLRKEIKLLTAKLEQVNNNPSSSLTEIEEINNKLQNAIEASDYWESAYANLEIKFDNKDSQLKSLLAVKKNGKKYFNLLSQRHAKSILLQEEKDRNIKANTFRKVTIENCKDIKYSNNRISTSFIDKIHVKSVPVALRIYLNALKNRLGSNYENVIGENLIFEVEQFLDDSNQEVTEA